jgi:hypothetical protein
MLRFGSKVRGLNQYIDEASRGWLGKENDEASLARDLGSLYQASSLLEIATMLEPFCQKPQNPIQRSKARQQDGMEWNGMEWNGEWNGMEWNGMEWNGME